MQECIWLGGTKACEFLINNAELTKPVEPQRTIQKLPTPETAGNSELFGGKYILLMSS